MTDRLTAADVLRIVADGIWTPREGATTVYGEEAMRAGIAHRLRDAAARREAEYERPKPTPGVKFYCSAVPTRTSCWGSNCPPDGCGYPVDARREAEEPCPVCGYDCAGANPPVSYCPKRDAPPPPAPDLVAALERQSEALGKCWTAQRQANRNDARKALLDAIEALRAENQRLFKAGEALLKSKHEAEKAARQDFERAQAAHARAEAAEADAKRLRDLNQMAQRVLARAFDRIHGLPRTSDTELANDISVARAALAQGGNDDAAA